MTHDAVMLNKFHRTMDRMLAGRSRRTDATEFTLLYIHFGDEIALGDRYGAEIAYRMLLAVSRDIRKNMRQTDIVVRDKTSFWVLVPHADAESVMIKLASIIEEAADNGFHIVERNMSEFPIKHSDFADADNRLGMPEFLTHAKSNCRKVNSWPKVE